MCHDSIQELSVTTTMRQEWAKTDNKRESYALKRELAPRRVTNPTLLPQTCAPIAARISPEIAAHD